MKSCKYCNKNTEDNADCCPSCGASEFNYICQNCSTSFDSRFCPNCGKSPQETPKTCPNCGNISTDLFCSKCGTSLAVNAPVAANTIPPVVQQPQIINNYYTKQNVVVAHGRRCNKWVALLICLCLGYFGAHKFYEGKRKMGIIYIFTFGICGIGWLIDCIVLLFKPNPYYV